jgi:hypothetical protein
MRFEATTPGEMSDGTDPSSHWTLTKPKRQRAYDYWRGEYNMKCIREFHTLIGGHDNRLRC